MGSRTNGIGIPCLIHAVIFTEIDVENVLGMQTTGRSGRDNASVDDELGRAGPGHGSRNQGLTQFLCYRHVMLKIQEVSALLARSLTAFDAL